ncbi:hypothetical protein FHS42_003110 [Streptomyces zagrosensis]|uniref:Uncharacterized protein n=1 Tax=Streptomyces zagrosensis TaxID=1042984 RepID=A0A7W9Q9C5_9ACTN|nr:hypothetical protein [Streptomyces zagrosensis]
MAGSGACGPVAPAGRPRAPGRQPGASCRSNSLPRRRGEVSPHDRTIRNAHVHLRTRSALGGVAARETARRKPSFAKELFLGPFWLDLIHPYPSPSNNSARRGEEFPRERLRLLRNADRQRPHRTRSAHPGRDDQRFQGTGRPGYEDRYGVQRARTEPGVLQQGPRSCRLHQPRNRCAALRTPVHRRATAAEDLRHSGAAGYLPAALRPYRHLRVLVDGAGCWI